MTPYDFDVALSFAGEDRQYVESVAAHLKTAGIRVFYDRYAEVDLWGKDLAETFDDIYQHRSRYVVFFISAHYAEKMWTRHERRSSLARALVEKREYILPARFDATPLPGLQPTLAYIDLRTQTPAAFAAKLIEKIAETVPEEPRELLSAGEVRTLRGHTDRVTRVLFSNDGTRAFSASADTTMRLWDLETGAELHRFTAHTGVTTSHGPPTSDTQSRERQRCVHTRDGIHSEAHDRGPGGQDPTGRLRRPALDIPRGVQLHRFPTIKPQVVVLHPARTHFLCATTTECELWNIGTGAREAVIPRISHDLISGIKAIHFSDDGTTFYIAAGRYIAVYATDGAKLLRELQVAERTPITYAFASDGRHVVRSADDTLAVFDLISGQMKQVVQFEFNLSLDISPDLTRVLGQNGDGCVLFDMDEERIVYDHWENYNFTSQAVALSRDGMYGLTGSASGSIRLWRFPARSTRPSRVR